MQTFSKSSAGRLAVATASVGAAFAALTLFPPLTAASAAHTVSAALAAPSPGRAPLIRAGAPARRVAGAGKRAPAHRPAPALLPRHGKILVAPAPAGISPGKAEINGQVHLGAKHPGAGRLIIPAPSAAHPARARSFTPSTVYSSTQLDNFSAQCGFGANETTIAQATDNPNLMVAGANTYYDNSGTCRDSVAGVYHSSDGGRHWQFEVMPGLVDPASGDPGVTYDPVRHVFLYSFVEFSRTDETVGRIGVEASSDGINWSRNTSLDTNNASHGADKPSITVDQNPGSPHYGRVAVAWTQFVGNNAIYQEDYTDDGGASWHTSGSSVNYTSHECGNGTSAAFDANGDLMIAWADCTGSVNSIYEELSSTGGQTWTAPADKQITTTSPIEAADQNTAANCFLNGGGSAFRCNSFPTLAGDPNSSDAGGTAFLVGWADVRSTTQSSQTANISQIMGLSTVDGGSTWGSLAFLNSDNFGDKFFPAASFSPNGRLTVSYSSREDDASTGNPEGKRFDEHQTEASSLTNLRAASYVTYPTDGTLGDPGNQSFIGDYAGNTSLDANFDTFPIWTDLRSGFPSIRTQDLCYSDCFTSLSPDNPLSISHAGGSTFSDFYSLSMDPGTGSGADFWNVVGIRTGTDGTAFDDDTLLAPNRYFNSSLASSSFSTPTNDYVVVNGNIGHAPDTVYFPQAHSFSTAGGPYSIEWDAGHITLGTSAAAGMSSADVARVYDTFLNTATTYYIGLRPNAGDTSNYSLTLHSASGAAEQGRPAAVANSGNVAPGSPALISYATGADSTQYDGVVVVNNNSGSGTYTLYRDTAAPTGTIKIDGGATSTNSTTLLLTLAATNPTSGDPVSDMAFSVNGGTYGAFRPYATSTTVKVPAGDAVKTVAVKFRNGAGALSTPVSDTILLDQTAPQTSGARSASIDGCGDFYGTVTISLTATDTGSGVASTTYQIDGGASHTYSGPFTVTGVGSHTVSYHSVDKAGNIEPAKTTSVPIVVPSLTPSPATGPVSASVSLSGAKFKSGESVKVFWDASATPVATLTAGASCAISGTVLVPAAPNGAHTLKAIGQTSGQSASHTFTVAASERLSPTSAAHGATVTVILRGFKASQSVAVHWNASNGPVLTTISTTSVGSANATFAVPASASSGSHNVVAVASGGPTTTAPLTVP
jgi:hypothetical protein